MALTLVTAAAAPIITLAEAKRHCRVDHDDDDAYIEGLVATVADNIGGVDGWLGRSLGVATWEYRLDAFPDGKITLPLPPLADVSEVEYVDTDGATQTVADFRKFGVGSVKSAGFVTPAYNTDWPATRDEPEVVRITFTAGYAALPPAIKHGALLILAHLYNHRAAVGVKMDELPMGADALLLPHRFWPS